MLEMKTKVLSVYKNSVPITSLEAGDLIYSYDRNTRLPYLTTVLYINEVRQAQIIYTIEFDSGLRVTCDNLQLFYGFQMKLLTAKELVPRMSIRAFSMGFHPRDGHFRVHGYDFINKRVKHQYRARMIWEYYNGKVPEGKVIHHINLDKKDDRINNFMLLDKPLHSSIHAPRGIKFGRNHKVEAIVSSIGDEYMDFVELTTSTGIFVIADDEPVSGDYSGIVCHQ